MELLNRDLAGLSCWEVVAKARTCMSQNVHIYPPKLRAYMPTFISIMGPNLQQFREIPEIQARGIERKFAAKERKFTANERKLPESPSAHNPYRPKRHLNSAPKPVLSKDILPLYKLRIHPRSCRPHCVCPTARHASGLQKSSQLSFMQSILLQGWRGAQPTVLFHAPFPSGDTGQLLGYFGSWDGCGRSALGSDPKPQRRAS